LVVVEEKTNYPTTLGYRNRPKTKMWPIGRKIAEVPSVLGIGREPSLLPQINVEHDYETKVHNVNYQLTKSPIFPILDRPKPVLEFVKTRSPILSRRKLLGVFGVLDPQAMTWPAGRRIGELPSVMSILSGPRRTVHPLSVEW